MELDTWRRQKKLTISQLAALLGIDGRNPTRTAQRYLTAERIPTRTMMRRIAEITGGKVTGDDFPLCSVKRCAAELSA